MSFVRGGKEHTENVLLFVRLIFMRQFDRFYAGFIVLRVEN